MKLSSRVDPGSEPESQAHSNGKRPARWWRWTRSGASDEPKPSALKAVRTAYLYLRPHRRRFAHGAPRSSGRRQRLLRTLILGVVVHAFGGSKKLAHLPLVGQTLNTSTGRLLLIGILFVLVRLLCFTATAFLAAQLSARFEYGHRRGMVEGSPEFYRALHRLVHAEFRALRARRLVRALVRYPGRCSFTAARMVAAGLANFLRLPWIRRRVDRLAGHAPPDAPPALLPVLSRRAASIPSEQAR